ncbi:MAG: hypothetical protein J6Q59_04490 [Paludibacteraceae bacterium]|nr:hypothetical protein [Paludibacteraceae bacterium]
MRKSVFDSLAYTFKALGFHYGEEALEKTYAENSIYFEDVGIKFHFNDDFDDRPLRQRLAKAKIDGLNVIGHKNGNQSWLIAMDFDEFLRLFCKAYDVEYSPIKKGKRGRPKPPSIAEISEKARAAGMSYGQYVSMQQLTK